MPKLHDQPMLMQVPPDLTDHSGIMPFMGSTYNAGIRPQHGYPGGAAQTPGMPTNITDYAASLIGFGGQPPAPGAYPGAGAAGLHALETGLGLGGSGLATNSVPLLPSALTSGNFGAAVNPFQVGLAALTVEGLARVRAKHSVSLTLKYLMAVSRTACSR